MRVKKTQKIIIFIHTLPTIRNYLEESSFPYDNKQEKYVETNLIMNVQAISKT